MSLLLFYCADWLSAQLKTQLDAQNSIRSVLGIRIRSDWAGEYGPMFISPAFIPGGLCKLTAFFSMFCKHFSMVSKHFSQMRFIPVNGDGPGNSTAPHSFLLSPTPLSRVPFGNSSGYLLCVASCFHQPLTAGTYMCGVGVSFVPQLAFPVTPKLTMAFVTVTTCKMVGNMWIELQNCIKILN